MNAASAKERVKDMVEEWDEADDGQWVEVVEDVVGHTIRDESSGLKVGCCAESTVIDVGNGVEQEYAKR